MKRLNCFKLKKSSRNVSLPDYFSLHNKSQSALAKSQYHFYQKVKKMYRIESRKFFQPKIALNYQSYNQQKILKNDNIQQQCEQNQIDQSILKSENNIALNQQSSSQINQQQQILPSNKEPILFAHAHKNESFNKSLQEQMSNKNLPNIINQIPSNSTGNFQQSQLFNKQNRFTDGPTPQINQQQSAKLYEGKNLSSSSQLNASTKFLNTGDQSSIQNMQNTQNTSNTSNTSNIIQQDNKIWDNFKNELVAKEISNKFQKFITQPNKQLQLTPQEKTNCRKLAINILNEEILSNNQIIINKILSLCKLNKNYPFNDFITNIQKSMQKLNDDKSYLVFARFYICLKESRKYIVYQELLYWFYTTFGFQIIFQQNNFKYKIDHPTKFKQYIQNLTTFIEEPYNVPITFL